jgi:hypothetical protein
MKPISVHPVSDLSKEQRASIKSITAYLSKFFAEQAKKIAAEVAAAYEKATKKTDDSEVKAQRIADAVSLEEWDVVANELADDLGGAYEQTAQVILGKLGVSDQDIFDLVNERSVQYAEDTGAELVTGITETTRERLKTIISDALENADGVNELKAAIEDSEAFSADRAEMIARTEIGNAHMQGALDGAKESGLDLMKKVIRGSEEFDCDICGDNEDQGEIALDELFESGDEAPLFHPNCECMMVFVVGSASEKVHRAAA